VSAGVSVSRAGQVLESCANWLFFCCCWTSNRLQTPSVQWHPCRQNWKMSKQLLRHWLSQSLPALKQGSTLSIRSSIKNTNLTIRSQWRDDGHLSMLQKLGKGAVEADLSISQEMDRTTSMGRDESHILVQLKPKEMQLEFSPKTETLHINQDTIPEPVLEKKVILDDGTILSDSAEWLPPPPGLRRIEYSDRVALITKDEADDERESETSLCLDVPEKVNIECDLTHGGSISIHSKIEGDVRLLTSDGDVIVKKLRGHAIDIQAQGAGNTVYSSDLLEAQSLNILIPSPGRLRAKRIHASSCNIRIGNRDSVAPSPSSSSELLDNDDAGSLCDISSLYVTGDANIQVRSSDDTKQAVRVKSHHGHVLVDASSPVPTAINEMTGARLPVVDMSGVNGSCEVFIQDDKSEKHQDDWVSCHVHFDSVSPDSVSILKADMGNVHVTVDRKVESDLRLLAASNASTVDVDTLLLDEDDDDDYDELKEMLRRIDESSKARNGKMITIQTKAFTEKDENQDLKLSNCEFVDGWVENKSAEPDSRFDRKLRGDTGSMGKIRLDGAANQALQGFATTEKEKSSFARPIVAITSTGEIVLETLSWLGNIARRYGLDDKKDKEDLGRTATRRGRPLKPKNE
jgi:hypothetical protein